MSTEAATLNSIKIRKSINETSLNKRKLKAFKKNYQLYVLLVLPIMYFIIFHYIPMSGIILAFRKFVPGQSIYGVKWLGFAYFKQFLTDETFWNVFKNTFALSFFNLAVNFPIPIIFALLLNEFRSQSFKKLVQTVSYLPKFFSTVIVISMVSNMLSPSTGIINKFIEFLGFEPVFFLIRAEFFRVIYVLSSTWQFTGWHAILYLAALAGIDQQLYEAAIIDGANRWKQTLYITIPSILPTIVILFILQVGYMLSIGFEKVLLLYSPSIYSKADIIQTYVYRLGLEQSNFSYATAVGLFQGVVSLILLTATNKFAKSTTEYSLW